MTENFKPSKAESDQLYQMAILAMNIAMKSTDSLAMFEAVNLLIYYVQNQGLSGDLWQHLYSAAMEMPSNEAVTEAE